MWSQLPGNEIAIHLGLTILHSVWQGFALGLLAWMALTVLRKATAQTRYGVACLALLLMLVLPVGTFLQLNGANKARHTNVPVLPSPAEQTKPAPIQEATASQAIQTETLSAEKPTAIDEASSNPKPWAVLRPLAYQCAPYATLLWVAGVFLLLTRLLWGHLFWQLLRHRNAAPAPRNLQDTVNGLCKRIGVQRPVDLLISARVSVPMVVGWIKPAILAPPALLTGMPMDQLEGLLSHELAHIRRFDPVVNFIQSIIETLLFYHPVAWWLSKQIRNERENCCDDIALSACGDPATYAESLMSVMAHMSATPSCTLSSTGGEATNRIRRILGMSSRTHETNRAGLASGLTLLMTLSIAVAFLSMAQPANAASARTLVFPLEESVGEVYTRDANKDWEKDDPYMGFENGWEKFADAKGDVTIPAGRVAMLKISTTDLAYLEWQDPGALFTLFVEKMEINDEQIQPIKHLTGLKGLRFWSCGKITDAGMNILDSLTNLEFLVLNGTLVQEIPQLANIAGNLKVLEVYHTLFNDTGIANLVAAEPWQLGWMSLERSKVTEAGFATLRNLSYLKGITLEDVRVTDEGLRHIAAIKGLEILNLKESGVNDESIRALLGMKDLRELNLQNTKISDAAMQHFVTIPTLQSLELGSAKVTNAGVDVLRSSRSLWNVGLDHTGVTDEKAKELALIFVQNRTNIPFSAKSQKSTNPKAPKVGIYLSHYTATGPHWMPERYGYDKNLRSTIFQILKNANYDLYAVIEKDTEVLGELPGILAELQLGNKTIQATDISELQTLDVILTYRFANIHDEVIKSLLQAVRNGVGLVAIGGFGGVTPGCESPLIKEIHGMSKVQYAWWGHGPMEFEIANSHPILGDLEPGTPFMMGTYNGQYDPTGTPPDGLVLIDSVKKDATSAENEDSSGFLQNLVEKVKAAAKPKPKQIPFSPLYVREMGLGRLVRCNWHYGEFPSWPHPIEEFYTRCVNWAAKKPVDSKW